MPTFDRVQAAGLNQSLDPQIKARIQELVSLGINRTREVKSHLDIMVKRDLFPDGPLPPFTDRRYWPSNVDIRNHIYMATAKARFSKIDQENVVDQICQWKKQHPDDHFFFRALSGKYIFL